MARSIGDGDASRLGATNGKPIPTDLEFEGITEGGRPDDPHVDAGRQAHFQEPQGRVVITSDRGDADRSTNRKLIQRGHEGDPAKGETRSYARIENASQRTS